MRFAMDDSRIAIGAICVAAFALAMIDLTAITDRVNRKFNEPNTLRGVLLRVGRLASTLPLALGFMLGHFICRHHSLFACDPLLFFLAVGVMVSVGLGHSIAVRRIMLPSWFALVYLFLGLLFGASIAHKGGL